MKRLKRMLALWLVVLLVAGSVYVPALASEAETSQEEPASVDVEPEASGGEMVEENPADQSQDSDVIIPVTEEQYDSADAGETFSQPEEQSVSNEEDNSADEVSGNQVENEQNSSNEVDVTVPVYPEQEYETGASSAGLLKSPAVTTSDFPENDILEGQDLDSNDDPLADAPEMSLNEYYTGTLPAAEESSVFYKFIPSADGTYEFFSEGNPEIDGNLYQDNLDSFVTGSNGEASGFHFSAELQTGSIYYLQIWKNATNTDVDYSVCVQEKTIHTLTLNATEGFFTVWEYDDETGEDVSSEVTEHSVQVEDGANLFEMSLEDGLSSPEGKILAGWSESADGEVLVDPYYMTGDITLYAVWESENIQDEIVLTFDANGGYFNGDPETTTQEFGYQKGRLFYDHGCSDPVTDDETMEFVGWSLEQDGMVIEDNISIEENTTFYAIWRKNFTVSFDANGGYFDGDPAVTTAESKYEEGSLIDSYIYYSPEIDDENRIFAGWSLERNGAPIDDAISLEENITLYAVWQEAYTVTYDANGGYFGSDPESETCTEKYEKGYYISRHSYSTPYTEDESKIFSGWSLERDGEPIGEDGICLESSITVYAVWKDACTVTFDANGGYFYGYSGATTLSEKYEIGRSLNEYNLPDPYTDDETKVFGGWSLERNGNPIEGDITLEENFTVYAVWKDACKVTLDANGGYFYGNPETLSTYQTCIIGTSFSDYGFTTPYTEDKTKTFGGWSLEKNGELIEDNYIFEESITIYAVWNEACTVTADANGGYFYGDPETVTVEYKRETGSSLYDYFLPTPDTEDETKIFGGWSLERDGEPIVDNITIDESRIVYAVWKDACTVTYDANGGYFYGEGRPATITEKCEIGRWFFDYPVSEPEIEDESRIFGGWSLEVNGNPIEDNFTLEGNLTVYAVWKEAVTVTFDANGGYFYGDPDRTELSGKEEKGIWFYNASYSTPEIDDDGRVFIGWSYDRNGTVIENLDFSIEDSTTFYAVWKEACIVTYDANGGYFDGNSDTTTITDKKEKGRLFYELGYNTPDMDDESKVFGGWSLERNGEPIDNLTLEEDITVYAIWGEACTVTYDANGGYFNEGPSTTTTINNKYEKGTPYFDWRGYLQPETDDVNKTFGGWSLEVNGNPIEDNFTLEGNLTVYAVWKEAVTVTFDANGGYFYGDPDRTELSGKEEKGIWFYNASYSTPEIDDDGRVFIGWSYDRNGTVIENLDFSIEDSTTFYAVWKEACIVTYDANGGYFDGNSDTTTITDKKEKGRSFNELGYNPPDIDDESKVFGGWSLEKNGEPIEELTLEENITVYAVWNKAYTVTFDANGGFYNGDSEQTTFTSLYEEGSRFWDYAYYYPTSFEGEEKVWDGWTTQDGEAVASDYVVTENVTVYARWKNNYQITFHANGGYFTEEGEDGQTHRFDSYSVRRPDGDSFSRYDFSDPLNDDTSLIFYGWSENPDSGELIDDDTTISHDMDLYAIWGEGILVTFDANDGYFEEPDDVNVPGIRTERVTEGSSYSRYKYDWPEKDGPYLFLGWSTTPNGEPLEENSLEFSEDIRLYAVWEEGVIITYDANGGYFEDDTELKTTTDIQAKGVYIDASSGPDISHEDDSRYFIGWSLTPDGDPIDGMHVGKNITFYAVWAPAVRITLDANGGYFYGDQDVIQRQRKEQAGIKIDSDYGPTPEKDDETVAFGGWSTTQDGKQKVQDGTVVDKDIRLYAIWAPAVTVTFDAKGGYYDGDPDQKTYTVKVAQGSVLLSGSSPCSEKDPEWVFDGYRTSNGQPIEDGITVTEDITVYAVWKEPCTITFHANGGSFEDVYDEVLDEWVSGVQTFKHVYAKGKKLYADDYDHYDLAKDGKMFIGWSTSPSGPVIGIDGVTVDQDMSVYAIWGDVCDVTLNANGGFYRVYNKDLEEDELVETDVRQLGKGWTITNADDEYLDWYVDVPKEGSRLIGWSSTKNGSPIDENGYTISGNTTLYAVWVKTGWNQYGSGWKYYVNSDKGFYVSQWAKIGGQWYYFDENEWMVTGWRKVGSEWYYFKSNGVMAANEWAKDSTGWCWMDANGKITKNKWIKSGNEWYYLKANGYMAANEWAKDSGGWYWMDASGKITKNKWIKSGNEWYYLKANGYMAANEWAKDSGGWYWMDASGKMTKNKWLQIGGKWYYFKANGYMATGTQTIGGKTYKFNSSGVWVQ